MESKGRPKSPHQKAAVDSDSHQHTSWRGRVTLQVSWHPQAVAPIQATLGQAGYQSTASSSHNSLAAPQRRGRQRGRWAKRRKHRANLDPFSPMLMDLNRTVVNSLPPEACLQGGTLPSPCNPAFKCHNPPSDVAWFVGPSPSQTRPDRHRLCSFFFFCLCLGQCYNLTASPSCTRHSLG